MVQNQWWMQSSMLSLPNSTALNLRFTNVLQVFYHESCWPLKVGYAKERIKTKKKNSNVIIAGIHWELLGNFKKDRICSPSSRMSLHACLDTGTLPSPPPSLFNLYLISFQVAPTPGLVDIPLIVILLLCVCTLKVLVRILLLGKSLQEFKNPEVILNPAQLHHVSRFDMVKGKIPWLVHACCNILEDAINNLLRGLH